MRAGLFWLNDRQWACIAPHLPSNLTGPERDDDRRIISGIIHILQCAASVQYTLHLITLSSDEPAAVKQSFIWSSTISACLSIGKRLISPVAGSYGGGGNSLAPRAG